MPAFEAALAALGSLNKADIQEMKTFLHPPALVQLTLEGVCILLQAWRGLLVCSADACVWLCIGFSQTHNDGQAACRRQRRERGKQP